MERRSDDSHWAFSQIWWKGDKDIKDVKRIGTFIWMLNLRCNPGHPCRNEIRVQIALAEPDQVGRKATRIFHLGVSEPQNRDSSIEPERWMDLPFRTTALDNPAANFLYSSWALYNHLLLGLRASAIPMHSLVCLWMERSWSAHFQEARSKVKAAKGILYVYSINIMYAC